MVVASTLTTTAERRERWKAQPYVLRLREQTRAIPTQSHSHSQRDGIVCCSDAAWYPDHFHRNGIRVQNPNQTCLWVIFRFNQWLFESFQLTIPGYDHTSGGAELLFGNVREHAVEVPSQTPDGRPSDVAFLIHWIQDNLLKERVDLFIENNTVYALSPRPLDFFLALNILLLAGLGFWSSSTTRTGNWKTKAIMS